MVNQDFGLGFPNPVKDSQSVFRAVLAALSEPGKACDLPTLAGGTDGLSPGLAGVLLTLTGPETHVALSPALQTDAVQRYIRFHTGAGLIDDLSRAAFIFVGQGDDLPALDQCNAGTQEYPDRSATVVVEVPALSGGPLRQLRGPGIETARDFSVAGLPQDFVTQWAENRELFPRGIDMVFVAGGAVLGLPRSTRMAEV